MVDLHQQRLANRAPLGSMRSTSIKFAGWVAVGAVYLGLFLVYAWNHVQILDLQFQIEEARRENQRLQDAKDALRAEFRALTRAGKITRAAREMGLVSINQPEILVVQGDWPGTASLRAEAQSKAAPLDE